MRKLRSEQDLGGIEREERVCVRARLCVCESVFCREEPFFSSSKHTDSESRSC